MNLTECLRPLSNLSYNFSMADLIVKILTLSTGHFVFAMKLFFFGMKLTTCKRKCDHIGNRTNLAENHWIDYSVTQITKGLSLDLKCMVL